jgi:hypothetical protein
LVLIRLVWLDAPWGCQKNSSDVDRSIALVGRCLIEQLSPATNSQLELGEWGSLLERTYLAVATVDCLSSYLLTGGEYLPITNRRLVESIASACLSSVFSRSTSSMVSVGLVKAALLTFGTACVCTPWPDGAASSIVDLPQRNVRMIRKQSFQMQLLLRSSHVSLSLFLAFRLFK